MATILTPPSFLAPAPNTPPTCFVCQKSNFVHWRPTNSHNPNGNAGRHFWKCYDCDQFLCFADTRGNDCRNPLCDCGESSKLQMSGVYSSPPRMLHFVCRLGCCNFFNAPQDNAGRYFIVPANLVGQLIAYRVV